ncbi:hypothetical protein [Kamptonema sp. UHCC 0994]|uniref:SPOR domain-containing protein n=1 Tax=Kamptonema sp. UHCC 0994 TaxID=3031329 RepID=UPI0023B8EC1F|nr:hypothetical protein [Kamptonema sp. UHCC 0994]MDF0555221.1 hypothetical protein [Kamptonema sp. UHCC 0994]
MISLISKPTIAPIAEERRMPLPSIILHKYYNWLLVFLGASLAITPVASGAIAERGSGGALEQGSGGAGELLSRGAGENYQLPITHYQLPITNYQLPITNYQLLAQNYPPYPPLQQYNPPPFPDNRIPTGRYVVYVNGDSPLLLQFVQQVEPAATVLLYKERRVIEAGSFFDESSAQLRVLQLRTIGVEAQITNLKDGQEFSELIPFQQPNYYPVTPSLVPIQQPNFIPISPNSFPQNNPGTGTGLYQVVVDTGSATLSQVRGVESTAFVRQYGGVQIIQAGSFGDQINAERRIETLAAQGIPATIVRSGQEFSNTIPNQPLFTPNQPYLPPVQPYISPTQPYIPPAQNLGQSNANSYFVVVSGNRGDLQQIRQEILRLGVSGDIVVATDIGGDPHVKVGPFTDQQIAERWERYLRDSGIKTARIYFGQ